MIISTFSGPAQGKAIGTWTAWTGIAFILGPLVGGFLVDHATWRLVFAINLLPIVVTLWLLGRVVAKNQAHSGVPVDITGSLLCAVGLGGSVYALIEQPKYGWGDARILAPLIIGVVVFAMFLWYERRTKHPMLPLSLFKRHNFSVGNLATLAVYAGITVSTFLIVVYLQQVGGYSALAAGLSLVPITLMLFGLSPRFGALSGRYGPRLFMGLGPIIGGLGFLLLLRVDANANYWSQLFPGILIFGFGLGVTVAPLTSAILGDVDPKNAGIASAINNAVARVAGLIAVAAVGAVVAAQFSAVLDQRTAALVSGNAAVRSAVADAKTKPLVITVPKQLLHNETYKSDLREASVSAFHRGVWVMSGLLLVGGAISAIGIKNPKQKT